MRLILSPLRLCGAIGSRSLRLWSRLSYLGGVVGGALLLALRPSTWRPPVRSVLARQVLFTGVEGVPFISFMAFLVGVSVVVQIQLLFRSVGQSQYIGPLLVAVLIREIGPLFTNIIVIGRSGAAIATEVANMKVNGELHTLDCFGVDPFVYVVVPRVIAVALSVFCLSVIFVIVSLFSGFVIAVAVGAHAGNVLVFIESIFRGIQPVDILNFVVKTLLPGLMTGAICASQGAMVLPSISEVPKATTRSLVRSVAALFTVCAIVSLLTYY